MVCIRSVTALLAAALLAAACSTTDGLVPPEDVGTGSVAGGNRPQAYTGQSQPLGPVAGAPAGSSYPPAPSSAGFPQGQAADGSLDAQARALAAGNGPMQPPPPQYGAGRGQPVANTAAAGNAGRTLGAPPRSLEQQAALAQPLPPAAGAPGATAAGAPQPQPQQPTQQQAALPPAAGDASIRFLPIIGAPVEAVTPLSRQLGAEARAKGLTIKGGGDAASHILKGYFSAFSDEGKVNVVYVWDVLDGNGARLHRIQGQESFASAAADPWSAVPAELMQAIASKTIEAYLMWRNGGRG